MDKDSEIKRDLLRHIIATLAYRCGKTIANAPAGFINFKINEGTRTPGEILAHIGDLLDWSWRLMKGQTGGLNSKPLEWDKECARFFSLLRELDIFLDSEEALEQPIEKIFQGPIADALTHTGQIALLRRAAGSPVKGENYFKADITAARVGSDQSAKRFEFD
jgi:hypothetical protein